MDFKSNFVNAIANNLVSETERANCTETTIATAIARNKPCYNEATLSDNFTAE
jgi:hypothetical protein